MSSSYGNLFSHNSGRHVDPQFENLGYTVLDDCISAADADIGVKKLESVYQKQVQEFGSDKLEKINELDMVRAPLIFDDFFLYKLALNPKILAFIEKVIEGDYQIHLQNGVINRPQKVHHQTHWHRDLPYQNWVASKPLSVSVLLCLTDFSFENGSTFLIPGSHKIETLPSENYIEENKKSMSVKKGSAMVFNSMVMHAAGINTTQLDRVGVNHVYTIPLIKQQINWTQEILEKYPQLSDIEQKILGIKYDPPRSVTEWRSLRLKRIQK